MSKEGEEEGVRLNSSRPPFLQKCLEPKTTEIGFPFLSVPCRNILFCAISFDTSDSKIEPFGTKLLLQLKHFTNIADAFSTSESRARRNLLSVESSTSSSCFKNIQRFHDEHCQMCVIDLVM